MPAYFAARRNYHLGLAAESPAAGRAMAAAFLIYQFGAALRTVLFICFHVNFQR
jgi:hypothetical protein